MINHDKSNNNKISIINDKLTFFDEVVVSFYNLEEQFNKFSKKNASEITSMRLNIENLQLFDSKKKEEIINNKIQKTNAEIDNLKKELLLLGIKHKELLKNIEKKIVPKTKISDDKKALSLSKKTSIKKIGKKMYEGRAVYQKEKTLKN